MNNLILQCKETRDFVPHPEGIHPAVCVDVMDLGLVETEFQGQKKRVNKLKLVFESEQKTEDGKACIVTRNFTASLHPKAKLADFLGKWRGRPVLPGETIDLAKLLGASCTLVISHQQTPGGKTYASIDAVSKPTKKVTPSGGYDPAAARQRYADWKARQESAEQPAAHEAARLTNATAAVRENTRTTTQVANVPIKKGAVLSPAKPAAAAPEYDPEVGF